MSRENNGLPMLVKVNMADKVRVNTAGLVSLEEYTNTISLEFNPFATGAGLIASTVGKVAKAFGEINDSVLELVHGYKVSQIKDLHKMGRKVPTMIKNVSYSDIANIRVPVLMGMQVTLIEVNTALLPVATDLEKDLINTVDGLDSIIAQLLSDRNYRESFSPRSHPYKDVQRATKKMDDALNEIMNASSNVDRLPIEDILPNMSSLKNTIDDTLAISAKLSAGNLKIVNNLIKIIVEKIELLHTGMQYGDLAMTKESLATLAISVDSVARYVTTATGIYYVLLQQMNMLLGIDKILKSKM